MAEKPEVIKTATQAWNDLKRASVAMPLMAVVATGIFAVSQFIQLQMRPDLSSAQYPRIAFHLLIDFGFTFLLIPFYLAIHRYIILNETTDGYPINPAQRRFQLFFIWIAALNIGVAAIFGLMLSAHGHGAPLIGLTTFAILFISLVLSVRIVIMFPAIAVDAPGAGLRNALLDTSGNFWRIVGTGLVASLPLLAGFFLLGLALGQTLRWAMPVITMISSALAVAVASRLYLALGDRLNHAIPSDP